MNYYEILGINENAQDKEIKQAYRNLAKKWHPDVHKGNKTVAKQKFSEINKAWEVLKDKQKKEDYDKELQIGKLTKAGLAPKTNMLASMFAPYAQNMPESDDDSDMNTDTDSPIKDHADFIRKFKALKKEMRENGQLSGSESDSEIYIDPRAEEKKKYNDYIEKMKRTGMDSDPNIHVTLEEMYKGVTKKIKVIRRTGEFSEKEDYITVTVRPNAFEGDVVKVPSGGHLINFQNDLVTTPGDAMVNIVQIDHPIYKRKFFDLHGTIDITVDEAENGFTKAIKGVDGEDIVITVPKLKRSDHVHKVYSRGMKRDIDSSRGHVYFTFTIVFDKNKHLKGDNKSEEPNPDDKKIKKEKHIEKQNLDDEVKHAEESKPKRGRPKKS